MWYVVGVAFLLGIFFGGRWCHAKYKAHRKLREVTLKPERDQFKIILHDLEDLSTDLKGTARLLAERAATQPDEEERTE